MNNDPNSIADWFDRHGMDGSYPARERFFRSCGWSNYSGTAAQNTAMLNVLKANFGNQQLCLNNFNIITLNIILKTQQNN